MDKAALDNLIHKHNWLKKMLGGMPQELRSHWEVRNYRPGDVICEQEGTPVCFYVLLEGTVKAEHTAEDGSKLLIAYLTPGEMISDIELATGRAYICTTTALTKSVMLALRVEMYRKWFAADNQFLQFLTTQLAEKLYAGSRKSIDQVSMSLRHKLLRFLYRQIEHYNFNEHVAFIATISREELAAQWGVTLRSVNRVLKELRDRQVIYVKKNQIICNETSRYFIAKELEEIENLH
ncbi:Crp/Fnr family transcriptional regulator [Paenibacillus pinihumi]|uniref:Crp/Fnr family transcriptional regulator n=1 Tax=Paenibacillus pinihumi TaxID=669462 RepID=UPI0004915449|nr:Crp/Fnr family transcriptional regulator [Paenibacillus pinihumi]